MDNLYYDEQDASRQRYAGYRPMLNVDEEDANRGNWSGFRPASVRGLTFDQACASAKTALAGMGGNWWLTVSCDRIKQELIAQPSLFTCPHEIRCALIPSGAGACTAAQCNTTPPTCVDPGCGTGKHWVGTPTCACVNDGTPPPTGSDNTLLYVGLGAVAILGILLATGGLGGGGASQPKVLYAKPA